MLTEQILFCLSCMHILQCRPMLSYALASIKNDMYLWLEADFIDADYVKTGNEKFDLSFTVMCILYWYYFF